MLTAYYDCMDHHNHTHSSRDDSAQHVSDSQAPAVSEVLPAFLDHLRVEDHCTHTTLIRSESHIRVPGTPRCAGPARAWERGTPVRLAPSLAVAQARWGGRAGDDRGRGR